MDRVAKRPQQRDRDRIDLIIRKQRAKLLPNEFGVQRREDPAVRRDSFRDLEHVPAIHQRLRLVAGVNAEHLIQGNARGASVASHHRKRIAVTGAR